MENAVILMKEVIYTQSETSTNKIDLAVITF